VKAVVERASVDNYIVLAMVDVSFADMAINLYEASFKSNHIDNFLFVGAGIKACQILWNASLPCYHYTENADSNKRSQYGTLEFIRKMNIRTDMILEALHAGFTVVHVDLDMYFFTNPLAELKVVMLDADVAAMWDGVTINAGFVVVKPSVYGKMVYEIVRNLTTASRTTDDQVAFNNALEKVSKLKQKQFRSVILDKSRYLCGKSYFEDGNRWYPDQKKQCNGCQVLHNNWIVSYEAKVYRFREHLMWMTDNDGYYSREMRNFITYKNTMTWQSANETTKEELEALKVALALGQILNRVVILPRFHCYKKTKVYDCMLNSYIRMDAFDREFVGQYKESTYLQHPAVSISVKSEVTKPYFIQSLTKDSASDVAAVIDSQSKQLKASDIINWFGEMREKVLVFQSLYGQIPKFGNELEEQSFAEKIKRGFKLSTYRQYA
jgi:hypothetical protein